MSSIQWDKKAQDIFDTVIGNLPQFHRSIAEQLVKECAEEIAASRGSQSVQEKDLIEAFFREVPPAFRDMMRRLFQHLHIDYQQFVDDAGA